MSKVTKPLSKQIALLLFLYPSKVYNIRSHHQKVFYKNTAFGLWFVYDQEG